MNRTGKYSRHSSIILSVFPNSLLVVYKLGGAVLVPHSSQLNFRFCTCFEKGVLDIEATIECGFTLNQVRHVI